MWRYSRSWSDMARWVTRGKSCGRPEFARRRRCGGITPVSQIGDSLARGPLNPVANDTESNVPLPRRKRRQEARASGGSRRHRPQDQAPQGQIERRLSQLSARPAPTESARQSALFERGPGMSSTMYGGMSGSGGVGVGSGSPFGNRTAITGLAEAAREREVAHAGRDPRLHSRRR
jgi:hypothetical protein